MCKPCLSNLDPTLYPEIPQQSSPLCMTKYLHTSHFQLLVAGQWRANWMFYCAVCTVQASSLYRVECKGGAREAGEKRILRNYTFIQCVQNYLSKFHEFNWKQINLDC